MILRWLKSSWQTWKVLCVLPTVQRESKSKAFQSCDGTCSVNTCQSDKLSPTVGALKQLILKVHVQARVWGQASTLQQVLLDPMQNGYHKGDDGQLKPTTTDDPPAPRAIIEMVSARETVPHKYVPAGQRTCSAPTFACAPHSVKMMRTQFMKTLIHVILIVRVMTDIMVMTDSDLKVAITECAQSCMPVF